MKNRPKSPRKPPPKPPTEPANPTPKKGAGRPALRLEWRTPAELADNPANWRVHPDAQIAALTDVVAEVDWAGACLYNERTKRLIDGHARKKIAVEQGVKRVPVLVGSWSKEQEAKILATLDPLSAMATADADKLNALLESVQTDSEPLTRLLEKLAKANPINDGSAGDQSGDLDEKFHILVECRTERQQATLLKRFAKEGLTCRSLIS